MAVPDPVEATSPPWYVVSRLPGRLRLRTHRRLAGSPEGALLVAAVQRLPGVQTCRFYGLSGNLVVQCRPDQTEAILQALGDEEIEVLAGAGNDPQREPGLASVAREGHDHHHHHISERVHVGDLARLTLGALALAVVGLRRLLRPGRPLLGPRLYVATGALSLLSGYPFFRGGLRTLRGQGGLDTDALVSVATVASLALRENVVALVVLWLLNIGEFLQDLVLRRTRRAIADLIEVGEPEVWVATQGVEVRVPLAEVRVGNVVVVYPHQKIPVDGEVIDGGAAVNQSPITGEALPVDKNPGDWVYAGTIVEAGELHIRARRVGSETAVARLIQRVEEAAASKAPIEVVGQRFARRFVPVSFLLAGLVYVATRDIRRSMTMLVIACPCAAGLATPTAISAAIGSAARYGALIKGGTHLEMAGQISVVVLDKTGTLTLGKPHVREVVALLPGMDPMDVLQLAASAEIHCQHPLAEAVVRHATEQEIDIPSHEECETIIALGVRADAAGQRLLVGNLALLRRFGLEAPVEALRRARSFANRGETTLYVARNDEVLGVIAISDEIRPEAPEAIRRLRALGIGRILMLTGDIPESAAVVAEQLGIAEFRAQVMPEEKLQVIRDLQAEGRRVAMVGDGVNDAAALAASDLAIAMGATGSDVAVETADVALAGNDLRQVASIIQLGRHTLAIIRQNYGLSIGVNAGGIGIGAAGRLNPFLAAALHNLSSLAVVLNSARLIGYHLDRQPASAASRPRPPANPGREPASAVSRPRP